MRDVRAKLPSPECGPVDDSLLLRSCIIQHEDANFDTLGRLPTYFREGITGDQLKVDCADIISYNAELAKYVLENPTESLPLVRLLSSLPSSSLHPRTWLCIVVCPGAIQ